MKLNWIKKPLKFQLTLEQYHYFLPHNKYLRWSKKGLHFFAIVEHLFDFN